MVGNYKEEITFENDIFTEEVVKPRPVAKKEKPAYVSEFFTPDLQEKVGKALLELKLQLYKDGIVDFNIKVACQDKQVILTAVPSKAEKKNAR